MAEKRTNPFNITFGEEPASLISRNLEFNEIIDLFESESPESKIKIITGPRGSGKTVLLSKIKAYFDAKEDWITADLTQYSNMLEQLAGKIYEDGKIKKLFLKKEFSFSFKGIGFSIHGDEPISNIESLLDRIFTYLSKKNVKVLITVDDVSSNDNLKQFVQTYQGFLRSKYPAYLLMTGLFENVSDLQNAKNLTFLLRAPKIRLSKLNTRAIALSYQYYLKMGEKESIELAKATKGYAYAFQLMGNTLYKSKDKKLGKQEIDAIDLELENNVYGKIWETMSPTDKAFAFVMLNHQKVSEIIDEMKINNAKFQVYRKRLVNIGVADDSIRGQLSFNLPRFAEFVRFQKELSEN